ncbi:hypothetical protein F0562_029272 [Nyssa sinensis]|uniref:Retrotransposon gag domain-containing protein n=1 Tax=Nyssa sinensis TaxID=561372 RepID=A0A5J5B2H8_9ASTE|nr:hypothetical protein F0562_029272 [Nyssa sinensis]
MNTGMLSPNTTYGAYLIVKFADRALGLDSIPSEVSVEVGNYQSRGTIYLRRREDRKQPLEGSNTYIQRRIEALGSSVFKGDQRVPCERDDGWLEVDLGEFYNDGSDTEVRMSLREVKGEHLKGGLVVEGIELRPKLQPAASHPSQVFAMNTRGKTNAEFRNEVTEALARHESNFDQVNTTLQTVLTEIQALRSTRSSHACPPEVNPMAQQGSSHHPHATPSAAGYNHSPPSSLKLQFPKFNGEDPMGWIYKAEQYFEYQGIRADQRVQLASFHLEGIALQWHRWHTKFQEPPTWEELTKAILLRFGPTEFEDPSEALSHLKQTTTVVTYQEAFERLSHRVDKLPETFLIGCFIAGLRDDIRLDVKIKQPRTLADTIGVARLVEERNQLQRRPTPINRMQTEAPLPRGNPNPAVGILGSTPSQRSGMGSNAPPSPFHRITNQEARERREKGLCYYCDEKYSLGHRCECPQLFMIEDAPHMEKENGENGEEPPQEAET